MSSKTTKNGGSASLGIYTEFAVRIERYNALSEHGKRYKLQSTARHILHPHKRLEVCNRVMAQGQDRVRIKYSASTKRAKYGGLLQCGNAWVCPVCSGQITTTRKNELHVAVVAALQLNLKPIMITYTLRHTLTDELKPLLNDLLAAYRYLTSLRAYKEAKVDYQFAGFVRALEVTYLTGWHPHLHVMMFVDAGIASDAKSISQIKIALFKQWLVALKRQGRDALEGIGVNVRSGDFYVAEYIAKFGKLPKERTWTIEAEMTKSISKKSKDEKGINPFGLLENFIITGDEESAKLFQEYAAAMHGRSMLQWSRGLAELLGVDLVDDTAALDMTAPDFEEIVNMDIALWQAILKTGSRAAVLDATEAAKGNAETVMAYLQAILERVQSENDNSRQAYQE